MKLHSMIIDNFLSDAEGVRAHALKQVFEDITSPMDGVVYPDISLALPPLTAWEMKFKLQSLVRANISKHVEFMRVSKKGVKAPHQAHSDTVMAEYTALVYLSRNEDCKDGATSVLSHVSGMDRHPGTDDAFKIWERDTNVYDQWIVDSRCPMRFNRLYLIRSDLYHRAEPVDGFGNSLENGRLVLTMFFDTEK